MRIMRYLIASVLIAGCSKAPGPVAPPVSSPPKDYRPSEVVEPTPPAAVVIELKVATLALLLAPQLGDAKGKQLAEILDGSSLIDVDLSADGRGRGLLVHRQKRTLYVTTSTPMRMGLTPAGAASRRAETLAGFPSSVNTPAALASWLEADPGAITSLRGQSGLPLTTLLGVYLIEPRPAHLACVATLEERPGITRLELTIAFLRHLAEFQVVKATDGALTLTGIYRIDGEDWVTYATRRLAVKGKL